MPRVAFLVVVIRLFITSTMLSFLANTNIRLVSAFSSRTSTFVRQNVVWGHATRFYSGTLSMKLQTAIVGLPNVGKSTLFNALTESQGAEAANYPFCTIERFVTMRLNFALEILQL